jgi:phosphatidylglycerophosphatase GEP4
VFGPANIAIFSNSAGFQKFDRDESLKALVEAAVGAPVLVHKEQKPRGAADLQQHFPGKDLARMAMIGDRVRYSDDFTVLDTFAASD